MTQEVSDVYLGPDARGQYADAEDETLKFYLARCQYALAGEVIAEPTKREFRWYGEGPVINVYEVKLKVQERFQFDGPWLNNEMTVYVMLPTGTACPDALKKGGRCVFFLNWIYGGPGGSTSFLTVDPWFGVQRYDPIMAERLMKQGRRPPSLR